MLFTKLLRAKKSFTKPNGDTLIDLISSTFDFNKAPNRIDGFVLVNEFEAMRPDLISNRLYGKTEYYEALLKYNAVSNPFSIAPGQILITPQFKALDDMIVPPRNIVEKGKERTTSGEDKLIAAKSVKDKKRLEALKNKTKEIVPPNVNTQGNKNVKVRDGKVIFGEDVTQVNKDNCPVPISRTRLIQQLTKANLF
jgi:hypothetical protein